MKKYFLVLLLASGSIFNLNAQVGVEGSILSLLYNPDFEDTGRAYLQGNVGTSYFKDYANIADDFQGSYQYDIKLMFKFIRDPKLINGALGIQFTENNFNLNNQYADISDEGITLDPSGYNDVVFNRIKMRSINMPLMFHLRVRDIDILNKFKFGVGVVPGYNFTNGLQKTKYNIDGKEYMLKEKSDFDMTNFRGSFLFEIFFNNLTVYYEHGINTPAGSHNFTTGVNKLGIGFSL